MRNNIILALLTAMASSLCWLPLVREPSLDFEAWVPLLIGALGVGLSTVLNPNQWLLFVVASTIGTFGGLGVSLALWPPSDPLAGAYIPFAIGGATVMTLATAFVVGLVGRRAKVLPERNRAGIWAALGGIVAFGPVAFLLTPSLVARRIAQNDQAAASRFASLKKAVEQTRAEADDPRHICDGAALRKHYTGPSFTYNDWQRITGNYVKQDGYFFMVYCREKDGYTIAVQPARIRGDGTRHLCADESGKLGCRVDWIGSRNMCLPCLK